MYFTSISELWHMAGHGSYVWAAYGASLIVLGASLLMPARAYRRQLRMIKAQSNSIDD